MATEYRPYFENYTVDASILDSGPKCSLDTKSRDLQDDQIGGLLREFSDRSLVNLQLMEQAFGLSTLAVDRF